MPFRSPPSTLGTGLACIALLGGCGSGGATPGDSSRSTPDAARPSPDRRAQLTRGDCDQLGRYVQERLGTQGRARPAGARGGPPRVTVRSTPGPPLSRCSYSTPSASVTITLDTATDSHQRFANRLVEAIQFSFNEPSKRPRRVSGVGDPGAESGGAVWTTSSAQLTAIRGNRLLIVGFYEAGLSDPRQRAEAAALARRAYAITSPPAS